jgi:hypothetical protein
MPRASVADEELYRSAREGWWWAIGGRRQGWLENRDYSAGMAPMWAQVRPRGGLTDQTRDHGRSPIQAPLYIPTYLPRGTATPSGALENA